MKNILASPERAAGIKALYEKGIALAISDEKSALGGLLPAVSHQRSLGIGNMGSFTLTFKT